MILSYFISNLEALKKNKYNYTHFTWKDKKQYPLEIEEDVDHIYSTYTDFQFDPPYSSSNFSNLPMAAFAQTKTTNIGFTLLPENLTPIAPITSYNYATRPATNSYVYNPVTSRYDYHPNGHGNTFVQTTQSILENNNNASNLNNSSKKMYTNYSQERGFYGYKNIGINNTSIQPTANKFVKFDKLQFKPSPFFKILRVVCQAQMCPGTYL
ncbi:hypothetical protein AYI70_g920 [Smittium culicis]|uniref:Uncharacterized protein n=1 Tax=Smittium culicis TaxID=133412 RepID=A0A1R1YEN6_9FUNG|nr:hypothetical protein AYI70_g920 [Smittium culicis]